MKHWWNWIFSSRRSRVCYYTEVVSGLRELAGNAVALRRALAGKQGTPEVMAVLVLLDQALAAATADVASGEEAVRDGGRLAALLDFQASLLAQLAVPRAGEGEE
ncbi:MAG: hypothetical protein AAF555_05715 [Verrucomicrobiota bacterium]